MNQEELEKELDDAIFQTLEYIKRIEERSDYIFYRDMYLTIERAKKVFRKDEK